MVSAVHAASHSPAMASALADIRREFGPGADTIDLKCRLRRVLRLPDAPAWKARYGARARQVVEAAIIHRAGNPSPAPCLHIAVNIIERHYRAARRTVLIADALNRRPCLDFMVLRELRLLLRFLRRSEYAAQFPRWLREYGA